MIAESRGGDDVVVGPVGLVADLVDDSHVHGVGDDNRGPLRRAPLVHYTSELNYPDALPLKAQKSITLRDHNNNIPLCALYIYVRLYMYVYSYT